jgi:DNA-binding HxlR family transcriptional regulator
MSIPTPTPATAAQAKESVSCPMDFILRMLMGPWTTYILYNLRTHGPQRFGELKRRVSGISAKMLTERLRTLEGASLVKRHYEATIPPKVTYSLTTRGGELDGVMDKLAEIAIRWEAEDAAKRTGRAVETKTAEKPAQLHAAE